jgi:hypothetical protein
MSISGGRSQEAKGPGAKERARFLKCSRALPMGWPGSRLLGSWLLGSLAPWLLGSLAPWLLGSLAPWLLDSLAAWLLNPES